LGNPLFAKGVLEDLKERGDLILYHGRWRIASSPALRIPRGVQEVVGRRMDHLGATGRAFLQLAAVFGREFTYRQVLCAWGDTEAALLDALDSILAARLIEETEEGYRFVHPVYRETAYQDLSRPRRSAMHRVAAKALETLYGVAPSPDADESLAHHWERSDLPVRAVSYLIRCGDRAAAVYTNPDALDRYRRALAILETEATPDDPALPFLLWEKIADTAALMGDSARSREALDRALAAAPEEAETLLRLRRKAAFQAVQVGDGEAACVHLEAAAAALGKAAPSLNETAEWANPPLCERSRGLGAPGDGRGEADCRGEPTPC
jgi:predicted ATPase